MIKGYLYPPDNARPLVTTLKRAWQRLTGATPGKTQADLAEKYTHFQALLSANNQVLTLMADMEEKLSGDFLFDLQYIRAAVSQLHQETGKLVDALNGLGANRYRALAEALARISREVEEVLTRRREIPAAPLVIDFEDLLTPPCMRWWGAKTPTWGRSKTGWACRSPPALPSPLTPTRFSWITITWRLGSRNCWRHWRLEDLDSLARVSEELKQMILVAQVPPELEAAIMRGL